MSKYYITTPIYYVNDKPHLGHAYTTLCADVLARWHRDRGDEVFFLTGTDEHGAKVQQAAEAAGLTPKEFADKTSQTFKQAWKILGLSHDDFIRTSQPEHQQIVQELLQKIYDRGFIYDREYEGLYCIGCEKFLQIDDLINNVCPLHPKDKPVKQKEKNYFFKLSAFREELLNAIKQGKYQIVPEERKNEIVGKLKKGLDDVSISRSEVSWGVPIPWDKTQTVYVWIDALVNYYSATQFIQKAKGFWPAQVHLLGKDILWFHAVIWEAFLLAAGLDLPKVVAAHGFFTVDGQKMSKSLGNVIDPADLIKEFGLDATRYLILSQLSFANDSDISLTRFRERYDSDLANGLGNTFSRVTNMAEKYGVDIQVPREEFWANQMEKDINNYSFDGALAEVVGCLREIDRQIDTTKPWIMAKGEQCNEVPRLVGNWIHGLCQVAVALEPFMPETAKIIQKALQADKITKADPLFPRLTN
ncbi:MAG: methionine--tRNA ligase [Patescibacteria group bacterium]